MEMFHIDERGLPLKYQKAFGIREGGWQMNCGYCGGKLINAGIINIGPRGGKRRVLRCSNKDCPYRVYLVVIER